MDCHDRANGGEATSRWLAVFPPPVIVEPSIPLQPSMDYVFGYDDNTRSIRAAGLIGRDVIRCRTAAAATEILTGCASRGTAAYDGRRPSTEVNPLSFVGMIDSTEAGEWDGLKKCQGDEFEIRGRNRGSYLGCVGVIGCRRLHVNFFGGFSGDLSLYYLCRRHLQHQPFRGSPRRILPLWPPNKRSQWIWSEW